MVLKSLSRMGRMEMARSPSGALSLLLAAGGAGLITTITAALKIRLLDSSFSSFQCGGFGALNFAMSFLCMQAFGFRLATKQSPLLGAAVGRTLQRLKTEAGWSVLKREFLRSLWTQALSAMGNLLFVILGGALFHLAFLGAGGHPFLSAPHAREAIQSLHLWRSHSLVHATVTGAGIWACSLIGGWAAQRLPPFSKGLASAIFNITLGVFLAALPALGRHLGLPLDVRHFTLSGGLLTLATASLGLRQAWLLGLPGACLGVLGIGALNFSVSFLLGLAANGLRPRGGPPADQALGRSSLRRILPTGVLGSSVRNSTCLGTL